MSSPAAPRLFLIRHGETEWTATGRHTGLSDIPLREAGEIQARALGDRLAAESFARVFTSPLVRARRTCELAGFGARAEVDRDLVEWDYGRYEGLTRQQIEAVHPDWDLFRDGAPGGETVEAAVSRADRVLAKLQALDADVAVFSSGHFIRMLAARWVGLPAAEATHFYTATASIGILGYEHGRAGRVIRLWNETARSSGTQS